MKKRVLKRKRSKALRDVTKEDQRHLQEFGERHPIYDEVKDTTVEECHSPKPKKLDLSDVPDTEVWTNPYAELIKDLHTKKNGALYEGVSDEDEQDLVQEEFNIQPTEGAQEFTSNDESMSSESGDDNEEVLSSESEQEGAGGNAPVTIPDFYRKHFNEQEIVEPSINGDKCVYQESAIVADWKERYWLKVHSSGKWSEPPEDNPHWRLGDNPSEQLEILYGLIRTYEDICWQAKMPWIDRVAAYGTHCLSHILRTRKAIETGNRRLRKNQDTCCQDQGFTRPSVLVIVPFREDVRLLVSWLVRSTKAHGRDSVGQREKFEQEFGPITLKQIQGVGPYKPADWYETFRGSTDDHFRIGLCLNRHSVKLFTPFYKSDMIVASPLGIRTMVQGEDRTREVDFLSSIEVLVIDRAQVIYMQNWLHLTYVLDLLNRIPKKPRNTDFSRVKPWYLDGKSKFYRQTILMSAFSSPFFTSLFSQHCRNHSGRVDVNLYIPAQGQLTRLPRTAMPVRYLFKRFAAAGDLTQAPEARLLFFMEDVLPKMLLGSSEGQASSHILVFIPSYYDYVRVRNRLRADPNSSFITLCEHTSDELVSRHRRLFFTGRVPLMLMTERFYFYRRFRIRGTRHLVFYELPFTDGYFGELCERVLGDDPKFISPSQKQCSVLYCEHDAPKLVATVGGQKAARMLVAQTNVQCLNIN